MSVLGFEWVGILVRRVVYVYENEACHPPFGGVDGTLLELVLVSCVGSGRGWLRAAVAVELEVFGDVEEVEVAVVVEVGDALGFGWAVNDSYLHKDDTEPALNSSQIAKPLPVNTVMRGRTKLGGP